MKFGQVEVEWLGHSGFLINNSKVIYVDPYKISEDLPKADLVLITHSHYDHCSVEDLQKIIQEGTRIVVTADSQSKVARFNIPVRIEVVERGQELDLGPIKISVVSAYNIDKTFHRNEEGLVGYLIKMQNIVIYHAGDTDLIPEMEKLTGHSSGNKTFIALLPIGGRFTMTAEEAFEAVRLLKPTIAIPMHWGSIVGSEEDAEEFKELCEESGFKVEILKKK